MPVFPPLDYSSSFLPLPLWKSPRTFNLKSVLSDSPPSLSSSHLLPALSSVSYEDHWRWLLAWELAERGDISRGTVLWKQRLLIADLDASEFSISMPGIREDHPKIEVGDAVALREVYVDEMVGSESALAHQH